MRFSFTAIFVVAVAALSVEAAAIPRRSVNATVRSHVSRMDPVQEEARAVPEVNTPVARSFKRVHARDFRGARS